MTAPDGDYSSEESDRESLGDIVLYEDAYGNIAVAINVGNAAEMVSARAGDTVGITVRPD